MKSTTRPDVTQAADSAVPSVAGTVWRFAFSGLLVLIAIVLATGQISRDLGEGQAFDEARQIARLTGVGIVQPLLDQDTIAGDPAALNALNEIVRESVLIGSLVRVKIWTADGRIVYSDESRLIGETYGTDVDRDAALSSGEVTAEVSDLDDPENRFERSGDALLEVYVPLSPDGASAVLYEASFRLDGVRDAGRSTWFAFAPITIGALLLLQLVQIPFAWSLARRVRRETMHREALLTRALVASEVERRRIAADLHDSVVQDLTGVSYTLSALSARHADDDLTDSARTIRASVRQLRSLLVDIYPPDLATEGLGAALEDLLARHRARGIDASLQITEPLDLSVPRAALVYRIAQEALRNAATHAAARLVRVVVQQDAEGLIMIIEDDGTGFDPDLVMNVAGDDDPNAGHFGLRILRDSAAELGGRLVLRTAPGQGTELKLRLPR